MINFIDKTPAIYSDQSRDYQILARLYNSIFNASKMYIDAGKVAGVNIDKSLVSLRAQTLNFNPYHEWPTEDLNAICTCFKYLISNKGTKKALEYCLNILCKIHNIKGEFNFDDDEYLKIEGTHITIYIPETLASIGVVEDLFRYLVPTGFTYRILVISKSNKDGLTEIEMYSDKNSIATKEIDEDYVNISESSESLKFYESSNIPLYGTIINKQISQQ